ncbi:MAG: SpoIIE family protein phosphatase [Bacteroidia bacterium]|nr:SpoIIE family protein phosphatase [Bacteroidia bacterium]
MRLYCGIGLWHLFLVGCATQPPDAPPSVLQVTPDTVVISAPDTFHLPDTVLAALRSVRQRGRISELPRVPLQRRSLSHSLLPLIQTIKLMREPEPMPRLPSLSELRSYLSFLSILRRESHPAQPQRISVKPRRFFIGHPTATEQTLFPATFYGPESGLPLTTPVECAVDDAFERVWIFSQNAMLCWGGTQVEVYSSEEGFPLASLSAGAWDTEGRLWVCGGQHLGFWDGKSFHQVPLPGAVQRVLGVMPGQVTYFRVLASAPDQTPLMGWIAETLHVWRPDRRMGLYPLAVDSLGVWCSLYEGNSFSLGLVRGDSLWRLEGWRGAISARHMHWDGQGDLWIAGRQGLWRWHAGEVRQVAQGAISALTEVGPGTLLVLHEGRLRYTQGDSLSDLALGLPVASLDYMYRRPNGEWLFFGREGSVIVMSTSEAVVLPVASLAGQKDWVFALHATPQGEIWVGLEEQGLMRLSPSGRVEVMTLPKSSEYLPLGEVVTLRKRDTALWLGWYAQGRRQGTWLWTDRGEVLAQPPYKEGWLDVVPISDGWIWQSHPAGISISPINALHPFYLLGLHPTTPFHRDGQGWLWFGTQEGLCAWTGSHVLRWRLPESSGLILAIASDERQRVWVGTQGHGLYCYQKGLWKRWTPRQGLLSPLVAQISVSDSGLWLGLSEGIAFLSESGYLISYRNKLGLPEVGGVNGGLFRSAHTKLEQPALQGALPPESWITGAGSYILCFPEEPRRLASPPRPYIASVEVEQDKTHPSGKSENGDSLIVVPYKLPVGLEIPYEQDRLRITFAHGGRFAKEAGVEYRVYLEGLDRAWMVPLAGSRTEYRRLLPGRYTLYLIARYPDSEWSRPVQFSFTVRAPWWLSVWAFFLYGGLLALAIWGIISWRTAVLRKRARELALKVEEATATIREQNTLLHVQNEKLAEQNLLILRQKEEIEQANRSLLESINYARRIQSALIPPEAFLQQYFAESFAFWKPRDIVSGDVYGVYSDPSDPDALYLFVADCTGHGVPGAFVSLMTLTLLHRTLTEYRLTDPAEIFFSLSQQLTTLLHPDTADYLKDGFEGVLARFEKKGPTWSSLRYAAARSPFWLIRDGTLAEQPYDPYPVGPLEIAKVSHEPFRSYVLDLRAGDWLYFASDGFMDQLGGPRGRKYGYPAFRRLLVELSHLSVPEQKASLERASEAWRGAYPQVDDVLVLGVGISSY